MRSYYLAVESPLSDPVLPPVSARAGLDRETSGAEEVRSSPSATDPERDHPLSCIESLERTVGYPRWITARERGRPPRTS